MEVYKYHSNITQKGHFASRNYGYVLDVSSVCGLQDTVRGQSYIMSLEIVRHAWLWLESVEDQVSADIRRVVEASKPDLMARGVAFDLLQMAMRVGPQSEAVEDEDLSGEKSLTLDHVVAYDQRSHRTRRRRHRGTLNESTNVGVKTGGSRVGGPELCVKVGW